MIAAVLRRIALGALTLWGVVTVTFVLVHAAPGEPFAPALENPRLSPQARAAFRARYGLDQPLLRQYLTYSRRLLGGDLGNSLSAGEPVSRILATALPRTLLLMSIALVAGLALGVAVGVWQAARTGTTAERLVDGVTLAIGTIPDFWIGIGLLLLFGYYLRWLPAGGMITPTAHDYMSAPQKLLDVGRHLALPVASLALLVVSVVARQQRAALLEQRNHAYVRTARAKGLSSRTILWRHMLPNALAPIIALIGIMLPALVGGAVFVETVFAWPGMGRTVVGALLARDYPLVLGVTLVGSVVVIAGALVSDILHAVIDPRLKRA